MLIGITNGREYRIPFEIDIISAKGTVNALHATAHLYPRGQMLKISAQMDLEQNRIVSHLVAKKLDLLRFADMFYSIDGLSLAGFASLEANTELQLLKLQNLKINIKTFNSRTVQRIQVTKNP